MNTSHDDQDSSSMLEVLIETAPTGALDLAAIRARGTRLRRRRQALTGGVAVASVALVVGVAFAASQPSVGPQPAGPAETTTATATEPVTNELPFDISPVQRLADNYGMRMDRAEETAPGVLEVVLMDRPTGITLVASVADASTPADGQSQLETMMADREHTIVTIDGGQAFRLVAVAVAGEESTDYAALADDGMRIVSLSIVPAEGDPADTIPSALLEVAESDLLPLLLSI